MPHATVVLADGQAIVRRGILSLLKELPDLRVIGEAADGLEAVALAERLRPDLLIVDLMLPGLLGLEVTRRVLRYSPQTRVILHSTQDDESSVREALRLGASGYVLKGSHAVDLPDAVREVLAGRQYLSPPLAAFALDAPFAPAGTSLAQGYETLTNREREVLQLAAEGHSNAEIAARLSISPRTAEAHRSRVLRKLGLRNQTALVRFALRFGLLPDEPPAT